MAFSTDVALACSASSQQACSSVAAGIRRLVKTRRNVLSRRAQPTLIICRNICSASSSVDRAA